jgi:hypothetical protein
MEDGGLEDEIIFEGVFGGLKDFAKVAEEEFTLLRILAAG